MPPHDAYARRTPYELLLPAPEFAEERFPRIEEEAEARDAELDEPGSFVLLAAAGEVLREIRPPDEEAESIHRYGALLFHAFHFWRAERPLYLLTTHVARYLVEADVGAGGESGVADGADEPGEPDAGDTPAAPDVPDEPDAPILPAPAGYLQLPRHLFWSAGDPPEPVDGIFWASGGVGVSLLVVLGVRSDRPGFSVVPVPTLPSGELAEWTGTDVRDEGEDFRTTLPGGEIENLYSLVTAAEAVKLAARAFTYLQAHPDAVDSEPGPAEPVDPPSEAEGGSAASESPAPSGLPYRRITLR